MSDDVSDAASAFHPQMYDGAKSLNARDCVMFRRAPLSVPHAWHAGFHHDAGAKYNARGILIVWCRQRNAITLVLYAASTG